MANFVITEGQDPFLLATLEKDETIFAESDAMVMMEHTLDLEAEAQGGWIQSTFRKMANDNSFFRQAIKARRGAGDVLLSSRYPGNIVIIDINPNSQFYMNDGVFVACEQNVQTTNQWQRADRAFFGGTGGWMTTLAQGSGKLVIGGFGDIFKITVKPNEPAVIDNNHVLAWSDGLKYSISASTSKSKGFFGNIINSQLTGEGLVTTFKGSGDVYISSKNKLLFEALINKHVKQTPNGQ